MGYSFLFSDSDNTESDKYILQVAGVNEYLQNDSLLQDYVYVHECYKFDRDVEFIVLLRDNNLKTLARTADDDKIDAKVTVCNYLINLRSARIMELHIKKDRRYSDPKARNN